MIKIHLVSIAFITIFAVGCKRGPEAIPALYVDARGASQRALELYDVNRNGQLDVEELQAAPGLEYAAKRADTDGDNSLSQAELTAMVDAWNEKSIGLLTLRCNVKLNKKPLAEATVRLEPETFLVGEIETAIGLTDEFGDAFLTVPKGKRPIADAPPGVQLGLYRVVISKVNARQETVPAKYNSATTLGQEVSFDDPGVQNGITFDLKK